MKQIGTVDKSRNQFVTFSDQIFLFPYSLKISEHCDYRINSDCVIHEQTLDNYANEIPNLVAKTHLLWAV